MSSEDESSAPLQKKRKLQRACDLCRRKKIRCDGPQKPGNRCSRCITRKVECTYKDSLHKGSYPSSYVENLESRLQRMEQLVNKLCPDGEPSAVALENQLSDKELDTYADSPSSNVSRPSTSRHEPSISSTSTALALSPQTPTGSDDFEPSDDDGGENVTQSLRKLSLQRDRYHGKSSGYLLIRTAIDLKNQYAGDRPPHAKKPDHRHPWLKHTIQDELPVFHEFPPDDLLDTLVELYFRNVNDMFPLLHEPTFKKGIQDQLHLRHGGFGATVLLVCANGSRFTRDARVLLDDTDEFQSAGWKYYQPVESVRKVPLAPAQLHDLQIYVLMIWFMQGTSTPQSVWTLIGIGIRIAVDVGAHRRKLYGSVPTLEEELWRRAFWNLVVSEWAISYGLGRPSSINDEDIDLALPTELDDEYWGPLEGDPSRQQPPDKPSKITFFVFYIKSAQVLAYTSRTLYSIKKSKNQLAQSDTEWEQRVVSELDSALNKWMHALPAHLRWDPEQPDVLWMTQAATLSAHYYMWQIVVHRPFMSASRRESPLAFPSVIICTNAARSITQVLDTLRKRTGTPYHKNMGCVFVAGIVLMVNIWGQRRAGRAIKWDRDLAYVRKCLDMLQSIKYEMHACESLCYLLNDLLSALDAAPPPSSTNLPAASTFNHGQPSTSPASGPQATSSQSFASRAGAIAQHAPQHNNSYGPLAQTHDNEMDYGPFRAEATGPQHLRPESAFAPDGSIVNQRIPHADPTMASFDNHPPAAPGDPLVQTQGGASGMADGNYINFDFGGTTSMFGPETFGHSEAVSLGTGSGSGSGMDTTGYAAQLFPGPGVQGDGAVLDFTFIDDTLNMWTNAPESFGFTDWGTYLSNANERNTGGSGGSYTEPPL
ncbi:fungal-specific transcription factor domain-containing protein [Daedaleopsis nitida]|nr:fungal-specific transcription factor domain-containing protein [Daedaleopsis nitida]